jgi:anti-sigma-K factor RskA
VYVAGTRFVARVPDATIAPDARRAALLAAAGELVRADFRATDDPLAAGAEGDLVWSGARQEGYMRFRNLPANDPTEEQYQLWIFDSTRADWEELPVDGGVFDVVTGGEVVVPIEAKLDVRAPALFAITLERPGGVVVSEREHLLLLGSP